jgi:hypothetical protein
MIFLHIGHFKSFINFKGKSRNIYNLKLKQI